MLSKVNLNAYVIGVDLDEIEAKMDTDDDGE